MLFVHDGIEEFRRPIILHGWVLSVVSPNFNMGLFSNALSERAEIFYGAFLCSEMRDLFQELKSEHPRNMFDGLTSIFLFRF